MAERPPFRTDNVVALRHGATSPRSRQPIVDDLVRGLYALRPDLIGFPHAVTAWGHAEAACIRLRQFLLEEGLIGPNGDPVAASTLWLRLETLAARHRAVLGLDPRSDAELTRSRADAKAAVVDLDGLRARGRELREAAGDDRSDLN